MAKYEMFDKHSQLPRWCGQSLENFLDDPQPSLYNGYNRGPATGIEAVQQRCWETLARLMAALVDKGVFSLDEVFKIADIEDEANRFEAREAKD